MSLADPRVAGRRARRGQSNPPRKYKPRKEPGPRDDLPGQLTLFDESQPSVSTMTTTSPPAGSLDFHPLADIFPLMEGEEFDALVADIEANDLLQPITLFEGMILDGRNRYRACQKITDFYLERMHFRDVPLGVDPVAFVIGANIHRRHLTGEQKRDLIAKLIAAQPELSNRQIAKQAKVHHETVGAERERMQARGDVAESATRIDSSGRQQPARKPPKPAAAEAEMPTEQEAVDDWRVHWRGMPAFSNDHAPPYRKINVLFDSEEAVQEFAKLIGQPVTPRTKSFWFPPKPRESRKTGMYHDAVPDLPLDAAVERIPRIGREVSRGNGAA
jgi:hypothetical protein